MDADMQKWVRDPNFHTLDCVAVGAPVVLTNTVNSAIGAVNGASGCLKAVVQWRDGSGISSLLITLDTTGKDVRVYRSNFATRRHDNGQYIKSTFPVQLAYALTGHKAQGTTMRTATIVHLESSFAPGLMYVLASRVSERSKIFFVHRPSPAHFKPVVLPGEHSYSHVNPMQVPHRIFHAHDYNHT
jgi:ATP-dependent DNA helicase PIF1